MRRIAAPLVLLAFWPAGNLLAWGPLGHKWIHARALESVPAALVAVFGADGPYLVDHALDPDDWRANDPEENPRHFIDLDRYGSFPFPGLTLDYDQMVQRHGLDKVKANGTILWTTSQVMARLEKAFRNGDRAAMLREAVTLGHYVADIHQPFHAVANYDGQLTGQRGIHGRLEFDVEERVVPGLKAGSGQLRPILDPVKETYDIALDSFSMVDPILVWDWKIVRDLKIDRASLPRDPEKKFPIYPEEYHRQLTERIGPLAVRRIREAAWAVASFWTQAWTNSQKSPP